MTAAEWILAGCAAATLLLLVIAQSVAVAIWIMTKIDKVREEIMKDFNLKHQANQQRYDALATLVTRHATILDPEFSDNGAGHHQRRKQQ